MKTLFEQITNEITDHEAVQKVIKRIFNKYSTQMRREGLDNPKDLTDEVYRYFFAKMRKEKSPESSVLKFVHDAIKDDKKQFIKDVLASLK